MKSNLKIIAATGALWLMLASGAALARPVQCGGSGQPPCPVPEPSSLPLFALGAVVAGAVVRFTKKK